VKFKVKLIHQLGVGQMLAHVFVSFEEREKIAFARPSFHGVALDQTIGFFARHAFLRERQQHALRMNETAQAIEVL